MGEGWFDIYVQLIIKWPGRGTGEYVDGPLQQPTHSIMVTNSGIYCP